MKSYECIICEYKTNRISNYKQHCNSIKHCEMAIQKNYCNICNKVFGKRKNLIDHNNYKHRELNIKLKKKDNNIQNNILMDCVNSVEKNKNEAKKESKENNKDTKEERNDESKDESKDDSDNKSKDESKNKLKQNNIKKRLKSQIRF